MKIDHVAIAVENLESALSVYKELFGLAPDHIETIETENVKEAMLAIGESHIQLIESTDPESTIAKFIAKNGPGLHHIAVNVDNLEEAMQTVTKAGGKIIGNGARTGGGGAQVAFVHPSSTSGVLIELVQTL